MRVLAATTALLAMVVLGTVGPVVAADPTTTPDMSGFSVLVDPGGGPELTPAERAIARQKLALAQKEEMHPGTVKEISHPADMRVLYVPTDWDGAILGTFTRQQTKSYYCGPVAVQVTADYAWGMGPDRVKYTQQYISNTWTKTDYYGQTYLYKEVAGLNGAVGSRLPAGFLYMSARPSTGSSWHSLLRTDIAGYYMPQVSSVSPKQVGATYWLTSWANTSLPAGNYGHYIVYSGYIGIWDGTESPYLWYEDGSGGYGGSTGTFTDPATHLYYMQWLYNPNHAAGYVIW
jgi:hypothetical protein